MMNRYRVVALNPLLSLLVLVGIIVVMYYIFIRLIYLLYYATPVLLAIAALLHFGTVKDHFYTIFRRILRDPLMGILNVIVQILGLPFVSLWLIFKSWLMRKLEKLESSVRETGGEYTTYEVVDEEPRRLR